jgi:hypothetical protein
VLSWNVRTAAIVAVVVVLLTPGPAVPPRSAALAAARVPLGVRIDGAINYFSWAVVVGVVGVVVVVVIVRSSLLSPGYFDAEPLLKSIVC